jgi:hypothetical protein
VDSPVILLSYAYSGAPRVQEVLAANGELACTIGTGILPTCLAAAESWQRVEGREGNAMSQLAAASVRSLVGAQLTVILTVAGKKRWCELALADRHAAARFLQVVPDAVFVCVHRGCLDVIRTGVASSPWGLYGQPLASYLLSYPGNSVAALAAYWAACTEELLSFEEANLQVTHRIRYEDASGEPGEALTALRTWLKLDGRRPDPILVQRVDSADPADTALRSAESQLPMEMIPQPLRQRISRLHAELGYAELPG